MLILQTILVVVLVAASAIFAAWRLSSASLRLRFLDAVALVLAPAGKYSGGRWLEKLRQTTLEQLDRGCHACSANKDTPRARR